MKASFVYDDCSQMDTQFTKGIFALVCEHVKGKFVVEASTIGSRLREERERLGLSQAALAEQCGVGRTAQFNYESEKRMPDAAYLARADRAGIDCIYVLTGEMVGLTVGYKRILDAVEMLLGLKEENLKPLAQEAVKNSDRLHNNPDRESIDFGEFTLGVLRWLRSSTKPETIIDASLLANSIAAVEGKPQISVEHKVQLALMVYRSALKNNGCIDKQLIEDALKLVQIG